ncbi:hypothetical protein [Hydrogenophaga sp.]|uniref:hypothetical protein n=1 Tax=Hydrogenophaga sp. TaxID=1904254 RepID=UPI00271A7EC9|nr:hypothetical protein [Hydrogenophaga sp.]MDO9438119.1 hypothetical protein [Hydrogenophaga sp.]
MSVPSTQPRLQLSSLDVVQNATVGGGARGGAGDGNPPDPWKVVKPNKARTSRQSGSDFFRSKELALAMKVAASSQDRVEQVKKMLVNDEVIQLLAHHAAPSTFDLKLLSQGMAALHLSAIAPLPQIAPLDPERLIVLMKKPD